MSPVERATPSLPAAAMAGALAGGALAVTVGFALAAFGTRLGVPAAADIYRAWLWSGGWVRVPLLGAAAGVLTAGVGMARHAPERGRSPRAFATAAVLIALALVLRATRPDSPAHRLPDSREARLAAIRRDSFRSLETVGDLLAYRRDPDPEVRQVAVLGMGVNLLVADVEHAPAGASRYAHVPLRDSLREALRAALRDSVPAIRVEAARALWKAPRTFGVHTAAAETLAATLDRAASDGGASRLAWLALDAAAGAPQPQLEAAAARFGAATRDTALRRAAARAARGTP